MPSVQYNNRPGFTVIELLVVTGIIVTLMALTLPVLCQLRRIACRTHCQTQITSLEAACNQYNLDLNSYPGLLGTSCWPSYTCNLYVNNQLVETWPGAGVTRSENLVWSLLGGIVANPAAGSRSVGLTWPYTGANYNQTRWRKGDPPGYDPFRVGQGVLVGPGASVPPLRQVDCYYKYKPDELTDFDGNGLYEFKDKSFVGLPVLYYLPSYGAGQNGSKYFNGPTGAGDLGDTANYRLYDPLWPDIPPVNDSIRNSYVHYLKGASGGVYAALGDRWSIYCRTWSGSGMGGSSWDLRSGTCANAATFMLISAGPDSIFGPDPKLAVKSDGHTALDTSIAADQQIIRRLVQDCDDATNWCRK